MSEEIETEEEILRELKVEALKIRKQIGRMKGEKRDRATKVYAKLFTRILQLEHIENPIYLKRYE